MTNEELLPVGSPIRQKSDGALYYPLVDSTVGFRLALN